MALPENTRIQILAPVVKRRKGEHKELLESCRKSGYVRVRIDGTIRDLSDEISLDKQKWHSIDVVVDRLVIRKNLDRSRVSDSTEAALEQAGGSALLYVQGGDEITFSEDFACTHCNISLNELEPRTFSFNNPHGACSKCTGLGYKLVVDPELVIPDSTKSIREGGVAGWARTGSYRHGI